RLIFSLLGPTIPKTGKQGSYCLCVGRVRILGRGQPQLLQSLRWLRGCDEKQAQLEADDRRAREDARERSELRERTRRSTLGEEADGRGSPRIRIVRRQPRGRRELALGRNAAPELPEERAVSELRLDVRPPGGRGEQVELRGAGRRPGNRHRQVEI